MLQHLRAALIYVVLTLIILCGVYPLVVLGIARTFFPNQAEGSLIDRAGKPVSNPEEAVGSSLIGQPFSDEAHFQSRPSATSPAYNAAASGASNWGSSNTLLRDRVARIIGPIAKYADGPQKGQSAGADIDAWFQKDLVAGKDKGIVAYWAKNYPTLATNWVKSDPLITEFVAGWMKEHDDLTAKWKTEHDGTDPTPPDMAGDFFESYTKTSPGAWPSIQEEKTPEGASTKSVKPVTAGSDVQSYFFDMWLQEHPDVKLEKVPADMVMASGSGLDPHITLKNAQFQADRVAAKWAERTKQDEAKIKKEVQDLLKQKAEAILGGKIRVWIVNVLELNLALDDRYSSQVVSDK
jgi:potassium-transporting ATPase KdpC subunit